MNNSPRAIADIDAGLILAVVDIRAPIEKVFNALTDPEQLPKWWGQADLYQTTGMMSDLRIGGSWRTDGKGADGHAFSVGGTYTALDAPNHVAFTWKPDWDSTETHVSYTLKSIDMGTRVTLRHSGCGGEAASCENHANGWERVFHWLDRFVAEPDGRFGFFVKLVPPRPTFAFDMTQSEREVMLAHSQYWRERLATKDVVVFGPVNDPSGGFGLGIVLANSEAEVREFERNDPAPKSGLGFHYEIYPMLSVVY